MSHKEYYVHKMSRPSPPLSANNLSIGIEKKGNDGNLWKVKEDVHGRHFWVMSRNKNYNLERSKSK
jgi:hypothetical protein